MTPPSPATHAPDGSPVEFFARFPADDEPLLIRSVIPPRCEILDLGCGAGRLVHPLIALGHRVVAVDQSAEMLAHVVGAESVLADIEDLDLGRRFPCVLLAGNLVNLSGDELADRFLATCARHVDEEGTVLIQRLDPEWALSFGNVTTERDGFTFTISEVHHDGDRIEATLTYGDGSESWQQELSGRVLDDRGLAAMLQWNGLEMVRTLDARGTWVQAVPA